MLVSWEKVACPFSEPSSSRICMEQLLDWIPAFAGMTVHTKNRNLGSKEDRRNLAVMKSPPV